MAYSIEVALDTGLFDEVMVSTDDEEIAQIARNYGARVPFYRSVQNSDDFATTYDVLAEVISQYKEMGRHFDHLCCIYPCAPLINPLVLKQSYQKLIVGLDTVIPVVPFSYPIQRCLVKENNILKYKFPEFELSRSQDLEQTFHDAGQFYWCHISSLLKNKRLISENLGYVELSDLEVQDIDNEIDWQLAEMKYKLNNGIS